MGQLAGASIWFAEMAAIRNAVEFIKKKYLREVGATRTRRALWRILYRTSHGELRKYTPTITGGEPQITKSGKNDSSIRTVWIAVNERADKLAKLGTLMEPPDQTGNTDGATWPNWQILMVPPEEPPTSESLLVESSANGAESSGTRAGSVVTKVGKAGRPWNVHNSRICAGS